MKDFLQQLLTFACRVAGAERGFVADSSLEVVGLHQLDIKTLQSERFSALAATVMQQATQSGEVVITNNVITDPSQAPTTNTSFSDLCMVVAIPLASWGMLYLERPIKHGIIARDIAERVMHFALHLLQSKQYILDQDTLMARFEDMP